jgi:prephenate dehydrogenase
MWHDILMANADQVDAVLDRFLAALDTLRQHIARRDTDGLAAFLSDARAARVAWNGPSV